ncbi:MAG: hypothetical protein IJR49_04460 [Treponema sp.]|nr:hypothetical protein [Treponema sp.]
MLLFGKKVEIFESNNETQFKELKRLLKANKIKYGTAWTQTEIVGGCGCKINMKQVANPKYSPFLWYVFVRPEDEIAARKIVGDVLKGTSKNFSFSK